MPSPASALREELRRRAEGWASKTQLPTYRSRGVNPTVLFRATPDGSRHGNFFDGAWTGINGNPEWRRRLSKAHQRKKALHPEDQRGAKELDSSNSSDALLMNCFCPPSAARRIARHLGLSSPEALPAFGFRPGVTLESGPDRTEIDMVLGDTFVEAKLTERDFKSKPRDHVARYVDVDRVVALDALTDGNVVYGFQLIRNVLAARQQNAALVVLIDARRPDLAEKWRRVHGSILADELRERCRLVLWQEVAQVTQGEHRTFLAEKYGL